jgi:hypothetical protein
MYYVCVENNNVVSVLNYRPSVPSSILVIEIDDAKAAQLQAQTHYFNVRTQRVEPVAGDLAAQKSRELTNAENKEFLNSTDWQVLRHIRQKALSIQTTLSDAQYLELEQQREAAASRIV